MASVRKWGWSEMVWFVMRQNSVPNNYNDSSARRTDFEACIESDSVSGFKYLKVPETLSIDLIVNTYN